MASSDQLVKLKNCTIRFKHPEGEYEGVIYEVYPAAETILLGKAVILPDRRMGNLRFVFKELGNFQVISRPNSSTSKNPVEKNITPVYPKTEIEKLLDLDDGSDIESEDKKQVEYELKLAPHLSKFVPRDFAVINCINGDFDLAIKHIRAQEAIGVSLEGVRVSRSGILSWLCISTRWCNFLFDILALGEQAFRKGLKSILESDKIQKIMHDCRLASDCLFHKYGVSLVNLFDTQASDFVAMMQTVENEKIDGRVNTLDACLNYYLEVPHDYLYGEANFDDKKHSSNFHALRPLQHFMQDILIKNVMYLHLLKREIELALMTPVRRATDIYLNSIQKLEEKELALVPHKPDELPLDMHLEGIQIFRYRHFEYLGSTVSSGPPYRAIANPIKNYLNHSTEYKNGQKKDRDCVVNKLASQYTKKSSPPSSCNSNGNHHKTRDSASDQKLNGVDSLRRSSESSSDSEKNYIANHHEAVRHSTVDNGAVSKSLNGVKKYETLELSGPTVPKPSLRGALERLLQRSRETLNDAESSSDESCRLHRPAADASEVKICVKPSVLRSTSNSNEVSSLNPNSDLSDGDGIVTSRIRRPTCGRMSPSEFLKLIPKMRSPKSVSLCNKDSVKDSIETSASDDKNSFNDGSKVERLPDHDSASKKDDLSDSEFEQILARVRRKGAILRNQGAETSAAESRSTSDPLRRSAELKSAVSSKNVALTSEDVNIYYSDLMDKPSQFVAKVKRKSTRLADLYKQAGDANCSWTEDVPESVPDQSVFSNCDDLWAKIRADPSCRPLDEKLRLRLIPAGMSGY